MTKVSTEMGQEDIKEEMFQDIDANTFFLNAHEGDDYVYLKIDEDHFVNISAPIGIQDRVFPELVIEVTKLNLEYIL